jgi:hypothetical protein
MPPRGSRTCRSSSSRLLGEARDAEARRASQRLTALDIAETGFGISRFDTEGHQQVTFGEKHCIAHSRGERRMIFHQVIRGQHQQSGIVAVPSQSGQRSHRDGRSRVASTRLQHHEVAIRRAPGRVFVTRNEEVIAVGDGDDLLDVCELFESVYGFLQQTAAVGELDERLRMRLARHRPEPGTAAPG